MDVLHTAIDVDDLDRMRGFYEGLLGLEYSRDFTADGIHNYYVTGAGDAELQFRVVGEPTRPTGIDHIAIAVDDIDAVVEEAVEEWDSEVKRPPETINDGTLRVAFFTDPEGYTVEGMQTL